MIFGGLKKGGLEGGQTQGDPNGHKWEDATCEEASYCSVCGKTEGVALGN